MGGSVFKLALEFSLINQASAGLMRINDNILAIARSNKQVEASYNSMMKAGKYALGFGVAAKTGATELKKAVDTAADLQEAVLRIRADMGGTGDRAKYLAQNMEMIKKSAFAIQAMTPFGETETYGMMDTLVRRGISPKDIAAKGGAGEAAAFLATDLKISQDDAANIMGGIAQPFKIKGSGFMGVADMIDRAATASAASADQLSETARYAAPALAIAKRSPQEFFAIAGILAKNNVAGSQAGTGLRRFFEKAASDKSREFVDKKGNLLPTAQIFDILRKKTAHMGSGDIVQYLGKKFGDRAIIPVQTLLELPPDIIASTIARMQEMNSLQEKMRIRMEGYNAQWATLKSTTSSIVADLYQPALKPLTGALGAANDIAAQIGVGAQNHDKVGKAVSYGSLGAEAGLIAATTIAGGLALKYGGRLFRQMGGFKGLMGTAGGVAEGKALEKVAGVTPVFVTNWPGGGVGGVGGSGIAAGAEAAGAATVLKKLPGIAGAGAGIAGSVVGDVVMGVALPIAAGAASYALTRAAMSAQVGTNGTSLDDLVQRFYAKLFSSKEEYNRDFAAKGDAFGDYNKDHHHLNQSITINIAPDGSAFIQTEADHYAYGNNPPMVKVNRGSWLN